jgi:hypothetical protein
VKARVLRISRGPNTSSALRRGNLIFSAGANAEKCFVLLLEGGKEYDAKIHRWRIDTD